MTSGSVSGTGPARRIENPRKGAPALASSQLVELSYCGSCCMTSNLATLESSSVGLAFGPTLRLAK